MMKIHKRTLQDVALTVYNDSNVDWVIQSVENGTMRFDRKYFTMSEAIDFYLRIYTDTK
jgi:hypothetical protein